MACCWWRLYFLCDLFRNLISVISKHISSDSFSLKKTMGKNKENTLEKPILSWGQIEASALVPKPVLEGRKQMSGLFCLISQTLLLFTPAWSQGKKLALHGQGWGQLNEFPLHLEKLLPTTSHHETLQQSNRAPFVQFDSLPVSVFICILRLF